MHSFWQRLNAIFFFALSVLGFLSFLGAGMTYWHVSTPRIELTLEKIVLRKIYGPRRMARRRPADSAAAQQPYGSPATCSGPLRSPRSEKVARAAASWRSGGACQRHA